MYFYPELNRPQRKSHTYLFNISVQPKPGFGIGNRNQGPILVLVPIFFFRNRNFFFQNFSKVSNISHFLGGEKFL